MLIADCHVVSPCSRGRRTRARAGRRRGLTCTGRLSVA
ncbi:hypothetical protein FM119_03095 [Mycetocola reblochoni REB411]|uniref:Uncharacterized protein n=1 Tax=Mycetocola reblochoni REB411 TaxID=1255698 RepID=A0A1R4IR75_9MICO|nr:hypothetical protein FM119_03095 [Mycetocola reblochoni REB411]